MNNSPEHEQSSSNQKNPWQPPERFPVRSAPDQLPHQQEDFSDKEDDRVQIVSPGDRESDQSSYLESDILGRELLPKDFPMEGLNVLRSSGDMDFGQWSIEAARKIIDDETGKEDVIVAVTTPAPEGEPDEGLLKRVRLSDLMEWNKPPEIPGSELLEDFPTEGLSVLRSSGEMDAGVWSIERAVKLVDDETGEEDILVVVTTPAPEGSPHDTLLKRVRLADLKEWNKPPEAGGHDKEEPEGISEAADPSGPEGRFDEDDDKLLGPEDVNRLLEEIRTIRDRKKKTG